MRIVSATLLILATMTVRAFAFPDFSSFTALNVMHLAIPFTCGVAAVYIGPRFAGLAIVLSCLAGLAAYAIDGGWSYLIGPKADISLALFVISLFVQLGVFIAVYALTRRAIQALQRTTNAA